MSSRIVKSSSLNFLKRQGVLIKLVCLCLIAPILPQFFPSTSLLILPGSVFLALLLFILIKSGALKLKELIYDSYVAFVLFFLLSFFCSIVIFYESVDLSVLKNFYRGIYLFACGGVLVVLSRERGAQFEIYQTFAQWIIILSFAAGCIGILKFISMENNFGINLLFRIYNSNIPWGSSLINDYNFFSLSLLLGLIFLSDRHKNYNKKAQIIFIIIFSILFWAGWLAGSRRFLILAPLSCITLFFLFSYSWNKLRKYQDIQAKEKIRESNNKIFIFFSLLVIFVLVSTILQFDKSLNWLVSARISTFFLDDTMMGFAPRVERWQFALKMFIENPSFFGSGFDYRREFGCYFEGCKSYDYPHNPILSAILYGGLFGFLAALFLFFHALILSLKALFCGSAMQTLGMAMFVVSGYSMISGDTFFSLPIFFVQYQLLYTCSKKSESLPVVRLEK